MEHHLCIGDLSSERNQGQHKRERKTRKTNLEKLKPFPPPLHSFSSQPLDLESSSSLPHAFSSFHSAPPVALGFGLLPGAPTAPVAPAVPAVPAPHPLFCPFAASLPSSAPPAPGPSSFTPFPSRASQDSAPSTSFAYCSAPDEPPEDDSPDAVPRDPDPSLPQVFPESMCVEFRRMLSFIIDLFPQAAGSPSVSPPPRALFEDFFASSSVPSPIFLNWFERICAALADALSHSMWVLSGLLAFVRLQHFTPVDSSLFNTLVTSLSKGLAHQASLSASHTAFLTLKRSQFYLSHLPAYFSDVNKKAMLSSPAVCADLLFNETDISRLLADTQTSSSLCSQQALVEVAWGSGSRSGQFSPHRSPARPSPSRRRHHESGSPARPGKRVCFDSPTPSSSLKGSRQGFRK